MGVLTLTFTGYERIHLSNFSHIIKPGIDVVMGINASDFYLGSENDQNNVFVTDKRVEDEIYPLTNKEIIKDLC